jgi:CubicO group peptidase (beta-lactamase class C family)
MALSLLLAAAGSSSPGQASARVDQAAQASIDAAIQRCLQEDGTPSASVAIVENGKIVYAAAFGHAVLHPETIAATTATRYQLASISKTFTAQAILLLEADGRLLLDDKVSQWYPTLTDASNVTIRELLNHTSGYPDHYPESYPAGPKGRASTPDQIIEKWGHHALLFRPGTQFHYSNLEYEIAGRIVEKVSGKPLFQFLEDRVFAPLGMKAGIDLDTIPEGSTELATGYTETALADLEPAPYEGPGWSFGSGQVVTTAQDLARWDAAFLDHRVLPRKQAAEEITPAQLSNGSTYPSALGLFVSGKEGVRRCYHTGQGLGFEAVNMIFPDTSEAIVVLTNTSVKPTYMKIESEIEYIILSPSNEDAFARKLFAGLQNGKIEGTDMSDDLKQFLTPKRLLEFAASLSPLGPVEAFSLSHTQTSDGLTSRDYGVTAGGKILRLHLLILPDGKLEDVTVSPSE